MKKIAKIIKGNYLILIFLLLISGFFLFKFSKSSFPIPADTIVGLYYPFRDLYADTNPNGIPFKNFLITDPVRQIIPWKSVALEGLSRLELPLWNPYEMAGKPLLANFQSSPFYPLNLLLIFKPFYLFWSVFIALQMVLGSFFFYLYLKNLKLNIKAIMLGTISYSFSGFFTSWFEWGNIIHTALWLPLVLLSVDKIFNNKFRISFRLVHLKANAWHFAYLFSLIFSLFAGHLQTFVYLFVFSQVYLFIRWFQFKRKLSLLFPFLVLNILFAVLTFIQWWPTLQFINLSGRGIDQLWENPGWFLPWQNLIQFFAPDFFGNPTTLNYWGIWNYAEFVGYIGLIPLVFALMAFLIRRDKKTLFFGGSFLLSIILALPTVFAKIPYVLNLPFLSSAQPTRLLFVSAFCLPVLSSLGLDFYLRNPERGRKIVSVLLLFTLMFFGALWLFSLGWFNFFPLAQEQLLTSKRNLVLPSMLLILSISFYISFQLFKNKLIREILLLALLGVVFFDMFRFFSKFNTFSDKKYFFPETKVVNFIKQDKGVFRVAVNDSRILPPNFSTYYKIQTIEGYDPLYLLSYAELIAASERGEPNINPPFGFNRIITPHNLDSKFIDLLNVKYVLSLTELKSDKLEEVFRSGQTIVYKNRVPFERAFFVEKIIVRREKGDRIREMFENDLSNTAIVEEELGIENLSKGQAKIEQYSKNKIKIRTKNKGSGLLVFTDAFYPTWNAEIDGKIVNIAKTDHAFRGVVVPPGEHEVLFYVSL